MVLTTLNDGGPHTVHNNTLFTRISENVYQATIHQSKTPTALVSGISWTGTNTIELRFTPINAVTKLRYIKTEIAT
jgi:Na+/H+ antiporter NhaB